MGYEKNLKKNSPIFWKIALNWCDFMMFSILMMVWHLRQMHYSLIKIFELFRILYNDFFLKTQGFCQLEK